MLTLTHRVGDTVHIGDDIKITVLGLKGDQIKVGYEAPPSVIILRDKVKRRNDESQSTQANGKD